MLTRRKLLLATGGIAAAAAIVKPSDTGGAHNAYFSGINQTLRSNGIDAPVLVIDLDRLDRNIDRVVQSVATSPAKTYRVVAKSIPSPELVDYVSRRANTKSMMVFHRPFLQAMAALNPQSDILMGKPMPIAAAHTSCPAFGGPDLTTLFCTTAAGRVSDAERARSPDHGKVFFAESVAKGQAEHRVIL